MLKITVTVPGGEMTIEGMTYGKTLTREEALELRDVLNRFYPVDNPAK